MAHVAEQGGSREPRIQGSARDSRGRRRGEDLQGRTVCQRRGTDEGSVGEAGGARAGGCGAEAAGRRACAQATNRRRRPQLVPQNRQSTTKARVISCSSWADRQPLRRSTGNQAAAFAARTRGSSSRSGGRTAGCFPEACTTRSLPDRRG